MRHVHVHMYTINLEFKGHVERVVRSSSLIWKSSLDFERLGRPIKICNMWGARVNNKEREECPMRYMLCIRCLYVESHVPGIQKLTNESARFK